MKGTCILLGLPHTGARALALVQHTAILPQKAHGQVPHARVRRHPAAEERAKVNLESLPLFVHGEFAKHNGLNRLAPLAPDPLFGVVRGNPVRDDIAILLVQFLHPLHVLDGFAPQHGRGAGLVQLGQIPRDRPFKFGHGKGLLEGIGRKIRPFDRRRGPHKQAILELNRHDPVPSPVVGIVARGQASRYVAPVETQQGGQAGPVDVENGRGRRRPKIVEVEAQAQTHRRQPAVVHHRDLDDGQPFCRQKNRHHVIVCVSDDARDPFEGRHGNGQGNERHRVDALLKRIEGPVVALALVHVFVDAVLHNQGPVPAIERRPAHDRIVRLVRRRRILRVDDELIYIIGVLPDKGEIALAMAIHGKPIGTAADRHGFASLPILRHVPFENNQLEAVFGQEAGLGQEGRQVAEFLALRRVLYESTKSAIGIVDALDRRLVGGVERDGQILLRPALERVGCGGRRRRHIVRGVPCVDLDARLGVGRVVEFMDKIAKVERHKEAGHTEGQNALAHVLDGIVVQNRCENPQKGLGRPPPHTSPHVRPEAQKSLPCRL